jgi:membrane protein
MDAQQLTRLVEQARTLYARLADPEQHGTLPLPAPVRAVGRWTLVFYKELARDRAFERAASLAYGTLIGMVPILMLLFSLLKLAGLWQTDHDLLESMVFDTFLGDIPQVKSVLLPGLLKIQIGTIGVIGTAGWLWIAFRMYLVIERTYSDMFRVPVHRGWIQRIVTFYLAVTLLPLLVGSLVFGSIAAASRFNLSWVADVFTAAFPIVLLTFAIKLLPCTHVKWAPALLGGTLSGLLIEAGAYAFGTYVTLFKGNDPVLVLYGSIGMIPIFLTWLWLVWIFVLFGVEVAHVAQNYRSLVRAELEQRRADADSRRVPSIEDAVALASAVAWYFQRGLAPITTETVAARVGIADHRAIPILELLERAAIVVETEHGWTVARPPAETPLADIVDAWRETTALRRHEDGLSGAIQSALRGAFHGTLVDASERYVPPEPNADDEAAIVRFPPMRRR